MRSQIVCKPGDMMVGSTDFAAIGSADELNSLLTNGGIDTSRWGSADAKSVDNLWAEIAAGESQIRTQPLQRVVLGAVNVLIRRGEDVLIETRQVFASGMTRHRDIPPAEKMQPGERPIDTAIRCLGEELGVPRHEIEIVPPAHSARREVRPSPSYPGLVTEYTVYTVEARVKGLPDGDFATHEYGGNGREWLMQHNWTWRRVLP